MSPTQTQNMSSSSSSLSSSSAWLLSYIKLRFFSRIRRFLQSKTARKRCTESKTGIIQQQLEETEQEEEEVIKIMEKQSEVDDDCVVLQKSVKRLHFGSWEEKEMAAMEIQRLAKQDVKIKKLMAELGVIHMLVSMAATEVVGRRRTAVKALIELANGTYTTKALMVEAGILSKLPNVETVDESTRHEFAELLLSLSTLANTQFPVSSSEILPFLVGILESAGSSVETKELCIGTLYNLSAVLDNAGPLVSNGVVQTLLKLSSIKEVHSEKSLATLGNLVVTLMGKKAMEDSPMVPGSLIEILTWEDNPKCQELSAYILMILAHQSSAQREKMAKSGIVQVILEVALLGSPLAQKRALKLLQWFKDERQVRIGPHSGPQTGRLAMGSPVNPREAQEGKKMMKNLVKQSLNKNMEIITRRANACDDSSKLKALIVEEVSSESAIDSCAAGRVSLIAFNMDGGGEGTSWVDNIFRKVETLCCEADEVIMKEIGHVENQLASFGANVAEICSNFKEDVSHLFDEETDSDIDIVDYGTLNVGIDEDNYIKESCDANKSLSSSSVESTEEVQLDSSVEQNANRTKTFEKLEVSDNEIHVHVEQLQDEVSDVVSETEEIKNLVDASTIYTSTMRSSDSVNAIESCEIEVVDTEVTPADASTKSVDDFTAEEIMKNELSSIKQLTETKKLIDEERKKTEKTEYTTDCIVEKTYEGKCSSSIVRKIRNRL
ncbi:hypothetical protein LWI29_018784 [Acer saccharum]|uniref:Uncharacterized protein n=1 Tax=Acer saccharum TaxID=4024 RepID=A0AA39RS95_ACESA|nr:hypothetical protein LWI29_018784 [Acer saccharum]